MINVETSFEKTDMVRKESKPSGIDSGKECQEQHYSINT